MKKRKSVIMIIFLLVTVLTITACGSANDMAGSGDTYGSASNDTALRNEAMTFGMVRQSRVQLATDGAAERTVEENVDVNANNSSVENPALAERRIIRTAWLDISTQDATALYSNIVEHGTRLGGFEQSHSISHGDVRSTITATFRIPPEHLSAFINFIGENGNILHSSMDSDDITESYFDSAIRLETKRRSLDRYYDLLATATGIDEIVFIQRIIDQITEEIEALEGRLRRWDNLVSMSTVNLTIRQYDDPMIARAEIHWNAIGSEDMGLLIRSGFFTVSNTIVSVLQWFIIILIGYSPLWILLGAGYFVFRRIRKKRKEKLAAKLAAKQNTNQSE